MTRDGVNYKFQLGLKRIFDLLMASISVLFTFPIYFIIAVAIKLNSSGPIIYKHRRIGKDGKPFNLYKFRTMLIGGDDTTYINYLHELINSDKFGKDVRKPYRKMQDDQRVTRVGGILRCYYLDELPQFINIIKGEMSLVGPRPHVQMEVDNYTSEQRKRLVVKPGATGLWQVAGKSDCTFSELIALDLEYIENWNIWLDIKIILATIGIMFRGGENFWTRTSKVVPNSDSDLLPPPQAPGAPPAEAEWSSNPNPTPPSESSRTPPGHQDAPLKRIPLLKR